MIGLTLHDIAKALGGEVVRGGVAAPGPNHSRADRSLSVRLSHQSPTGYIVYSHAGDDFKLCRDYVAQRLGLSAKSWKSHGSEPARPRPAARSATDDTEARIARAVALWAEGVDPRGTVVERYLASRGLDLPEEVAGASLRFHPTCPWQEGNQLVRVPAMLAAMRMIDGDRITAIHRTRLTADGHKVDRRMLGIAAGTAVKIDPDDAVTLGLTIGEGIETCMAARQLGFRPAWALASAGAVAAFPVRGGIEALSLLRERDPASDRACRDCGVRWEQAGRDVLVVDPATGNDINDALRAAA